MADVSPWSTIPEVVQAARSELSPETWDFLVGGADTELTVRRNRLAFQRFAFVPRVLRDVSRVQTATTFLDVPLDLPVMLAPIGSVSLFDSQGALASARAARQRGTAAFVSCLASPGLEDVCAGADGPMFLQLFFSGDRAQVEGMVRRAEAAGCRGICLTVDGAVYARRERDLVNRFGSGERHQPDIRPAGDHGPRHLGGRAATTWSDLAWLRSITGLPLTVKGIMCAVDAVRAVEHGVDAVYVSNHGGRQLDHAPASLEVLAEVVDAVAGRAEILVDGGFVRGSDVVKGIALGARAVVVGRLMAWGLAAGGVAGLVRTLELLEEEIRLTMANLGVARLDELGPHCLRSSEPVDTASTELATLAWGSLPSYHQSR